MNTERCLRCGHPITEGRIGLDLGGPNPGMWHRTCPPPPLSHTTRGGTHGTVHPH